MSASDEPPALSDEHDLIARFFRPLASHPGAFSLLDDAAAFTPPEGSDLVVTTDAVVGGVHFFADDPADLVARKALRVNLSDLAAKGARPAGFLIALALPADVGTDWLAGLARGLGADIATFGCALLGGDTVRTPGPTTIAITAFGTLPRGGMLRRDGARPGDRIVVTGSIGDAALGLALRRDAGAAAHWALDAGEAGHLANRYLLPQPRLAIADVLRGVASAAMDVSDGLAGDLGKLCRASTADAEVEVARVPLSPAARKAVAAEPALLESLLCGGDDYEIIATVPETKLKGLRAAGSAVGVSVTDIGRMVAGGGEARFLDRDRKALKFARPSYSHF